MKFCSKCGEKTEEGVKVCSGCGSKITSSIISIKIDTSNMDTNEKFNEVKEKFVDGKEKLKEKFEEAQVKEKFAAGAQEMKKRLSLLPFRRLAEEKIPAEKRVKFPVLNKIIPMANFIACGFVVLLVVGVIASAGGDGRGASTASNPYLAEDSSVIITVIPGLFFRMSTRNAISDINSIPEIDVIVEDDERVRQDWEIIRNAYNIRNNVVFAERDNINDVIAMARNNPRIQGFLVTSFENEDHRDIIHLRQRWLWLLRDDNDLLPGHRRVTRMLL